MAAAGHFLTFNSVKLELLAEGNSVGAATGFFIKHAKQWWLVSNWHVFSGRNPQTGQSRHPLGAVPSILRYVVLGKKGDDIVTKEHHLPLGDLAGGQATWKQHPKGGQEFDIAAIRINEGVIGAAKDFLDPSGHDADMFMDLGAEVFLPGFPLGLSAGGPLPIWKRASLASSLEFPPGSTTYFLVDTATREGMSGSPCFAISNWRHYRMDRKTGKVAIIDRPLSCRFLGVYSGRVNAKDDFGAQLGVVWRENLVYEMLAAEHSATLTIS